MLSLKQKLFILVSMLLGLMAGGTVSLFQGPYVEASRSFVVENKRHAAQSVYDYEGYYTLQTAIEAAKALASWLTSPGGVVAVYADAGVEETFKSLSRYERAFSLRRADTPFFEVRFKAKSKNEAEKLSQSLETHLRAELAAFQSSDSLALGAAPLVAIERSVALLRNILYGAFLAGALTIFFLLFKKAMETSPQ